MKVKPFSRVVAAESLLTAVEALSGALAAKGVQTVDAEVAAVRKAVAAAAALLADQGEQEFKQAIQALRQRTVGPKACAKSSTEVSGTGNPVQA